MTAAHSSKPVTVFAEYEDKAWPYWFEGTIHVDVIAGGIPTNPNVAEGWIRSKLESTDDEIRRMVAETMVARGLSAEGEVLDKESIIEQVAALKTLNGFKRDDDYGLYIEGRQLKAALKEAVQIAVATEKIRQKNWGVTKKWIKSYFPEHVHVYEDKLWLNTDKPTGINQRFVTTTLGKRAIQYEEYVENASFSFHVYSDHDFTDEEWAMLWLTGQAEGIGAARSAGFGTYVVTQWDRLPGKPF